MKRSACRLVNATVKPRVSTTEPTPYSWINNAQASTSTGHLAGRSIAIKDNISYTFAPTSGSSKILQDYHPPYNATCVQSLVDAGAHITGQTKMDEFGMGSQTTHLPDYYTPVHNPSSPRPGQPPRSAGGSSGGSAAAVAEGSCWAALGTDTGGSVRLPASYCGVVGLKPSYGMISRHGVVSYADSLDCVGILGGSVDTVEEVYRTISHPDYNDMTCINTSIRSRIPTPCQSEPSSPLANLVIGIPQDITYPHFPSITKHLISLGAKIKHVTLPDFQLALSAYYVLACAEASSNLARYGGGWFGAEKEKRNELAGETGEERRRRARTEGFGQEVKKRILAGTHALSADEFNNTYLKALHIRRMIRQDYARMFRLLNPAKPDQPINVDGVDVLLHPTSIGEAPVLSDTTLNEASEYQQDTLTVPASLAGLPAMSVPAGKGRDGWPLGLSVTGQWGMEETVFRVGKGIESWQGGPI